MTYEFTAPFNWCDRLCERCPLADECPLYLRERGRRWARAQRGEDPDDLDVAIRDISEDLQTAFRLVEQAAAEDGISLEELEATPPPPVSLVDRRLQNAALAYFRAVDALGGALVERGDDAEACGAGGAFRAATTISMKMARLGGYVTLREVADDVGSWRHDAVPNLLLVEHLDGHVWRWAESSAEADRSAFESFAGARQVLRGLIAAWTDAIPSAARAELAERIDAGAAPSPYCTVALRERA